MAVAAIWALHKIFVTHGLLDTLVSNNRMAFTLGEFQKFMTKNGICHIRSTPFRPATNGQAERLVRTTKDSLWCLVMGEWQACVVKFLLYQHITPCTTTSCSPVELLMGCKLMMHLDCLHLDRAIDERPSADTREAPQGFFPGDTVYTENHGIGQLWVQARVIHCVSVLRGVN